MSSWHHAITYWEILSLGSSSHSPDDNGVTGGARGGPGTTHNSGLPHLNLIKHIYCHFSFEFAVL